MSVFYYNGRKFINGYACDGMGKPITIKNGYSSDDEKHAKLAYEEAMLEMREHKNTKKIKVVTKKHSTKIKLSEGLKFEQLALFEDYELEEAYAQQQEFKSEYMLNDAGEEISIENGYSDADERFSKQNSKAKQTQLDLTF